MKRKPAYLFLIDDDRDILFSGALLLRQQGYRVSTETDPKRALELFSQDMPDLILLDMNFRSSVPSGNEGLFWLREFKKKFPLLRIIMLTAYGEIELAVEAMKSGALHFITKPWENEKLEAVIAEALKKTAPSSRPAAKNLPALEAFIGESAPVQRIKEQIRKVAGTEANVLLLGENGTGKELVAKALHELSERHRLEMVTVDLGSITETLFESELFGHRKGAFTDAREDKTGKIELAQNTTLFLDEIGNLSSASQAKLLTVLQNRKISRVGDHREIPVNFRLVSATNEDLTLGVEQKTFRQDLLYRINTITIRIPALRERKEDIPLLAQHFLDRYSRHYQKPVLSLSAGALHRLSSYRWPGNVRELQHVIERAVIFAESGVIQENDLEIETGNTLQPVSSTTSGRMLNLEEREREAILQALEIHKGNLSLVARELGLSRAALYRRLEKYGV